MDATVVAHAPGRVVLIGDHTDHAGGLVLPLATQLGTTVTGRPGGSEVTLRSAAAPGLCRVPVDVEDPASVTPAWGRYVAGVVAELRPSRGFTGTVTSTLPMGAGLASSAALEVAVALALGYDGPGVELAQLCRRAEQRASGVPCGVMDQLASVTGEQGSALLIDCRTLAVATVPMPDGVEIVVVDSGERRELAGSAYAERQQACAAAAEVAGPLRDATLAEVAAIADPVLRRRARHVVSEIERVVEAADALRSGDVTSVGRLMVASHRSLRDDFEVSTPALDALVERLLATPGVLGARLTGAGFGGCAVALTEPGALAEGWRVTATQGAHRRPGGHGAWFARPD